MGLFGRKKKAPVVVVDPAGYDPIGARLRGALLERDWRSARDLLVAVTDHDERIFYLEICSGVPGVQDWIGEWVAAEPDSTLPRLVRGAHAVSWAWEARGGARAAQTSEEQFHGFFRRLKLAEDLLDEVTEQDPDDPAAWAFLVRSARGREVDSAEAERRFAGAIRSHPFNLMAHRHMLSYLCKKWSGSDEEMFAFARETVEKAPDGSPLAVLAAEAHLEMWLGLPSGEDFAFMKRPETLAELNAAADRSYRHPDRRRGPGWHTTDNTFALAFSLGGHWKEAKECFETIGDRATEYPWFYVNEDSGAGFTAARAETEAKAP